VAKLTTVRARAAPADVHIAATDGCTSLSRIWMKRK
jgi:hypothetical protein